MVESGSLAPLDTIITGRNRDRDGDMGVDRDVDIRNGVYFLCHCQHGVVKGAIVIAILQRLDISVSTSAHGSSSLLLAV
jgi:hypothetical protein